MKAISELFSVGWIVTLLWIALGIGLVIIIVIVTMKFLKKETSVSAMEKAIKAGNFKKALAIGLKEIQVNPNDFVTKYYIAQSYEGLHDFTNAAIFYEKATLAASGSGQDVLKPQLYMKVAELNKKRGNMKEALGYYMLVLEKIPKHSKAMYEVGEIFFETENFKKAREYLESFSTIKPDHIKTKYYLGQIYYKLTDYNGCVQVLESIKDRATNDDVMYQKIANLLADSYLVLKRYENAIKTLSPLLENRETFEAALVKVVDAYVRNNQYEKAIELARANMSRLSKNMRAELLYQIGSAYFKYGEIYKAVVVWKEAFDINPAFRDLKDLMTKFKMMLENPSMETVFTRNLPAFEQNISKRIKMKTVNQIVRKETYWMAKSSDVVYVIYRLVSQVSMLDLEDIASQLRTEMMSATAIHLYSLFGVSDEAKAHFLYRKLTEINGQGFIAAFNQG